MTDLSRRLGPAPLLLALALLAMPMGCFISPNQTFNAMLTPTAAVPAATGTVHIEEDWRANSIVTLTVKDLPPPEQLTPPAHAYVVWEQEADAITKCGPLQNQAVHFTTAGRDFHLFITAEPSASVTNPTGPTVLQTQVSW